MSDDNREVENKTTKPDVDHSKREVLARLGKYAAYTAPVMLVTLGATSRKAEAQIGPTPAPT